MANSNTKKLLTALLKAVESLHSENAALKTVIMGCRDADTRANWENDVQKLLANEQGKKFTHALFQPIYEQINSTDDEAAVLDLLLKFPMGGKPS